MLGWLPESSHPATNNAEASNIMAPIRNGKRFMPYSFNG